MRQIALHCWLLLALSSALNLNQNQSQTRANSRRGATTLNFCLLTQARRRAHTWHAEVEEEKEDEEPTAWRQMVGFFYSMTPGSLGLMTSNTSTAAAAAAVVYFWNLSQKTYSRLQSFRKLYMFGGKCLQFQYGNAHRIAAYKETYYSI